MARDLGTIRDARNQPLCVRESMRGNESTVILFSRGADGVLATPRLNKDQARELVAVLQKFTGDVPGLARAALVAPAPVEMNDDREPLTERQQQIVDYIAGHQRAHGFAPTVRELAVAFGIRSTNGVADHLKALERKGYIQRSALKSRAIRLVQVKQMEAA